MVTCDSNMSLGVWSGSSLSLSSSVADTRFDCVIGHIEDIIMEDEFQTLQNDFMEKYYKEFEDSEECKFIYTEIHEQYINLIEHYLDRELSSRIEGFSMGDFQKQLVDRKEELEGEVFEMLLTFGDFMEFKDMFVDYRNAKEGVTCDLSVGIHVTPFGDGDGPRPSLDTLPVHVKY